LSGGSNQANRWGPIPKIFGIHKHFPPYGAETYTEIVGDEQFLRLYFVWGISRAGAIPGIQIENLKIGETALGQFEGVEIEHRNLILKLTEQTIAIDMTAKTLSRAEGSWIAEGIKAGNTVTLSGCTTPGNDGDYLISAVTALVLTYSAGPATTTEAGNGTQTLQTTFGNDPITLYTNSIHEDPEVKNILLEQGERVVRTSQAGPRELSVDISFPSLYANNPTTGARGPKTVTILIEYRETGAPDWQTATTLVITAASNSAVRRGHRWSVNEAADPDITYDIGITRVSPGPDDSFSASVSYWTALRSIWITEPFSCAVPVAKTIMRIKASNELSGTVDKFSALCSGIEPDWDKDTQTWVLRVTQNPASHFREMLQGPQNMDPYADSEIHLIMLQYWHEYCEAEWQKTQEMKGG
jgi:hypothetical protein